MKRGVGFWISCTIYVALRTDLEILENTPNFYKEYIRLLEFFVCSQTIFHVLKANQYYLL